ncbi:hypothetical protein ASPVEDRAFT_154294 [Aspergillus versicolor CBS 583.65]|uniref:Inner kinetochore subunit AME1 domain-containing protein n=1 Tax=Aspergillus versicolor CBS 583.65 TaxID=1036611 RepID=A0A1L9PXI4_ASPVE|nr:uncharacterized protein ASPVEDRAFT_154294 [Aspergillus versicolor CBS 583.65]OJJ06228.1 hypothetical protein ASPVEDRAFT_154294 [Aspergillus versicolor CBS 583.65]
MASNREERLQMRQRGAGTRKIKEVDFGFSLGFGAPAEESSQSVAQPANSILDSAPVSQAPLLKAPPPPESTTIEPPQTQSTSSPPRTNPSSQNQPVRRTPGSARNKLPPRPSTFDIPAEEEPELERTSKRRKIDPPTFTSPPPIGAQPETREPNTAQNGTVEQTLHPAQDDSIAIPIRTSPRNQPRVPDQGPPPEVPSIPTNETDEPVPNAPDGALGSLETEHAAQPVPEPTRKSPRVNGTASPPSDTTKNRGKGRGKRGRPSLSRSPTSNPESADAQSKEHPLPEPPVPVETPQEQNSPETELPKPREKRTRSRTPASTQPPEPPAVVDKAAAEDASSEAVPSDATGKGVRGRKKKNVESTEHTTTTSQDSNESTVKQAKRNAESNNEPAREPSGSTEDQVNGLDKGKKRAGRPKKQVDQSLEPVKESGVSGRKRQREERAQQAQASPEQEQPEADTTHAGKRGRPRKEREPEPVEPEPEPEIEQARAGKRRKRGEEREREPTPRDDLPEPETEPQVSRASRKQRDERELDARAQASRARKGKQRAVQKPTPEPEPEVEPESQRPAVRRSTTQAEEPAEGETPQERPPATKRKPRQPRGETVPITVHRLANAASLGGEPPGSSEDEADSSDEIATSQTSKLPSRGGVNAADVLAQICRETLEKTLATLKNGIANETNTARRAEFTLRRKAVEAFSTELEGRLFDLSEMLDSNFMLGTKVKRAKRKMMDLRSRLDHVRREREAVALRMDAVRSEHAREEQAGLARSTINHSLHNLELALERGQNRPATEDERLTAGLEFRLRNMAQTVSSIAQGAQGGLLNQIRRFNAQLETTARRLEG